jgi:hypothetical protein
MEMDMPELAEMTKEVPVGIVDWTMWKVKLLD